MKANENSSLAEEAANAGTVCQMLHAFRTGTQQTNEWKRVHHPPSEDEQGPIDRLVLDTPEQQAKLIFNKAVAKKSSDRVEDVAPFVPDFIGVDNLMNAAGVSPSRFEQAGFKIFQLRLAKQMTSTNKECDDQAKKKSASKMQWELILKEAEQRSNRLSTIMKGNMNAKRKASDNPPMKDDVMLPRQSLRILALQLEEDAVSGPPNKKRKSGKSGRKIRRCIKAGCNVTSDDAGVSFHQLTPYPPDPSPDASMDSIVTF